MRAGHHEVSIEHGTIEGPSDRSFGLTVGGILAALGLSRSLIGWDVDLASILMLVVGAALLALAASSPRSLGKANRAWMRLGALLGWVMTPLILLLVYVLTFVPIGFFLRLRGHDPLRSAHAAAGASYWIHRQSSELDGYRNEQTVLGRSYPMELVQEMFEYFKVRKRYWLAPILIVITVFGGLIVLTQGTAVAPFIYTLF